MKRLSKLSLLIGSLATITGLAGCAQQPHEVVTVALTWEEQIWIRKIELYEPCQGSELLEMHVPFWNNLVEGECARFSVVYRCECIGGKRVCGPPEGAIESEGREDCFKWPLPPLDVRSGEVRRTSLPSHE